MIILPKAADFICMVDGIELAWNNEFGLMARWRAAKMAKSSLPADLRKAAEDATQQIMNELQYMTPVDHEVVIKALG